MKARWLVSVGLVSASAACAGLVISCGTGDPAAQSGADDMQLLVATDGGVTAATDGSASASFGVHPTFTFESGPVRPIAMSADGTALYVANTANASLDVMNVSPSGISLASSTYVGIDPVSVAVRTPTEVWVVNRVSDSVSVVDVSTSPPHVVRTLLVGDDPSDIVFAGAGNSRAFVTTAHRGQRRTDPALASVAGAGDPQMTTPGIGRADVWVFDALHPGTTAGGVPLKIVTLFGDTPRALAVTPDARTVYAAVFQSGNQTTATSSDLPCDGFYDGGVSPTCVVGGLTIPGPPLGPGTNYAGLRGPKVSVLLKTSPTGAWLDDDGRDWTTTTMFSLPDKDVFAIDTTSLAVRATYLHVGTTLYGMAVNPASGKVYVTNTESRNDLRFEGPGTFAGSSLRGHLAESRVTVLDGTSVTPRYLDKHIDYSIYPAPLGTANHSLSQPASIVVDSAGATMYVAAFGSSKIGVLSTQSVENDTFNPFVDSQNYIAVSGGGPSGIVLDEAHGRMFVTTRFDDGISIVDLATKRETKHISLSNPEPLVVKNGRRILYDAMFSSSNGEAACASCHAFGDKDNLAWDLGNPDADQTTTPIPIKLVQFAGSMPNFNGTNEPTKLHPNKGPMTTQTLRGMVNHGPMHWRGDRVSGFYGTDPSTSPPYDSNLAFKNFVVAFPGLLGRADQPSETDMQTFASFALDIVMPPNPVRNLDDSLTPSQANGRAFFMGCVGNDSLTHSPVTCVNGLPTGAGHFADGTNMATEGFTCQGCHTLDSSQGFFGTNGQSAFDQVPQTMKIPQLRNLYDKIGMFGMPSVPFFDPGNNGNQGAQVRGTGFEHDGSVDTLFRFLSARAFRNNDDIGFAAEPTGDSQRRDVEQFLLAFDNDLAPIVGQQITLTSDDASTAGSRIDLMIARARAPFVSKILGGAVTECDLVARVVLGGVSTSFRLRNDGTFQQSGGPVWTDAQVRALATTPGQEVTYTCMPPGWLMSTVNQ